MNAKTRIGDAVDRLAPLLLEVSHRIHARPELAFAEHEAVAILCDAAAREGLALEHPVHGLETAFQAEFGEGAARVAILSEYDALPGLGHACGHNLIAAIGLGAALALRSLDEDLPGRVRYLGTPAEERGCGKEWLARAGAFEGVDAALMLHPAGLNAKAIRTLCLAEVEVEYAGRAAHASVNPEAGVNALDALVLGYQALAQLRQHLRPTEKVHGVFSEAGAAPNIVPEKTRARYYVRAESEPMLRALKERVAKCLEAAASATGCEVRLGWSEADYLDMRVNEPLADAYEGYLATLGRETIDYRLLPHGTTDMANVSHRTPVLHGLIACSPLDVVIHDPRFALCARSADGDRAIVDGAKALAWTAFDVLASPDLRAEIREAQPCR